MNITLKCFTFHLTWSVYCILIPYVINIKIINEVFYIPAFLLGLVCMFTAGTCQAGPARPAAPLHRRPWLPTAGTALRREPQTLLSPAPFHVLLQMLAGEISNCQCRLYSNNLFKFLLITISEKFCPRERLKFLKHFYHSSNLCSSWNDLSRV